MRAWSVGRRVKQVVGTATATLLLFGGAATVSAVTGSLPASAAPIAVTVSTSITGSLIPGSSNTVNFAATNPNSVPVTISTISFGSVTSSNSTCQALLTDYLQFSMATVTVNQTLPANAVSDALSPTGTLVWTNLPTVDQDPCYFYPSSMTLNVTAGIYTGPPEITSTSLPIATVGVPYSFQLQAVGGTPPYSWNKYPPKGHGRLPWQIQLSKSGLIAGTPKHAGTYIIIVKCLDATHSHKTQATQTLTLTVDP